MATVSAQAQALRARFPLSEALAYIGALLAIVGLEVWITSHGATAGPSTILSSGVKTSTLVLEWWGTALLELVIVVPAAVFAVVLRRRPATDVRNRAFAFALWVLVGGVTAVVAAVILGTGVLSNTVTYQVPGGESFAGPTDNSGAMAAIFGVALVLGISALSMVRSGLLMFQLWGAGLVTASSVVTLISSSGSVSNASTSGGVLILTGVVFFALSALPSLRPRYAGEPNGDVVSEWLRLFGTAVVCLGCLAVVPDARGGLCAGIGAIALVLGTRQATASRGMAVGGGIGVFIGAFGAVSLVTDPDLSPFVLVAIGVVLLGVAVVSAASRGAAVTTAFQPVTAPVPTVPVVATAATLEPAQVASDVVVPVAVLSEPGALPEATALPPATALPSSEAPVPGVAEDVLVAPAASTPPAALVADSGTAADAGAAPVADVAASADPAAAAAASAPDPVVAPDVESTVVDPPVVAVAAAAPAETVPVVDTTPAAVEPAVAVQPAAEAAPEVVTPPAVVAAEVAPTPAATPAAVATPTPAATPETATPPAGARISDDKHYWWDPAANSWKRVPVSPDGYYYFDGSAWQPRPR